MQHAKFVGTINASLFEKERSAIKVVLGITENNLNTSYRIC
ncbi:MAG: hypothetical protein JWR87_3659 [Segetibacter sp.]|jgi:hypothetical protein|nr:hypothetical protein [Segetibacter sp.]